MKKIKISICLFVICMFSSVLAEEASNAKLYNATSVEEINNTLSNLLINSNPQKTLTILSLSQLLKQTAPPLNTNDPDLQTIILQATKKVQLSKQNYLGELLLTEYEQKLADPYFVKFFKNLQKLNAPYLLTTTNVSGSFNKINYLEVWTFAYLEKKGIDLSKSPVGSKQIIFNKTHKKNRGTYPTLYRGLLSLNYENGTNSHQSVLAALLASYLKWMPDTIYIIDSDEDYIKSLETQFKIIKPTINIVGFIYTPKNNPSNNLSPKDVLSFWTNLAHQLNKVTRKEVELDKEDPYEK